jgi:hypothetical protein
MIKMLLYIAVALSALGIYTGAIEVRIHAEKLSSISGLLHGVSSLEDVLAQGQYYGTVWKRQAELYFAGSVDAKFTLDVGYIKTDTAALKKALDANAKPNIVIVKSKLLKESVDRAKGELNSVSEKTIATLRSEYIQVFAEAQKQLERLNALSDKLKKYQTELESIGNKIPLKF